MSAKKVSCKIVKHIGVISENNNYSKEVNIISWNGRPPVYDIRTFQTNKNGEKCPLKGISLNQEGFVALKELLSHANLEI